jgi:hypothetical protein
MLGLRTPLATSAVSLGGSAIGYATAHSQVFEQGSFSSQIVDAQAEAAPEEAAGDLPLETDLERVDRAHAVYLRDGELQLSRPEQEIAAAQPDPPPDWMAAFGRFLEALGPLFQVIFWIAVGLVVAGLLYFLFGEAIRLRLGGRRKPKDQPGDDVLIDIRPDAASARSLLEEADALAQAERFAEAVHLLLFRSIEDIQERVQGGVPRSLTAREIASLGRLPDRARHALKPIILIVERSFFGGRSVDADGWQEARRSYQAFAFGEGWT